MKVLVFLEQRDGQLKTSSLEALSVAATLSAGKPENVAAVLCGKAVQGLVPSLRDYGADTVYVAEGAAFELYNALTYTQALATAITVFKPDAVLGIASPMGRDIFPRLAARCDAGLITDLVALEGGAGSFQGGTKPMYAGKVLASVTFAGEGLKMATLRPNVFASQKSAGKASAVPLEVSLPAELRLQTQAIRKGKSQKADLTEAGRIISGGRALGSADHFKILDACAEVVGATVGASRAAVDSGYASHDMQVGQTGKTVNPSLYIACGISGSIQHMAGMRTSKVIVAINTDSEAPIFSVADYGIVADLFEAVPLLTQKLKALLG